MKDIWSGLILIFVLGISAGILTGFLASPKFWSVDRVEDEAGFPIVQSDAKQAIALYLIGARNQRNQRQRDRLYWKACNLSWTLGDNEKALNTCLEAAQGPKRMTQAKALLIAAGLYDKRGDTEKALEIYRDLASRYWDYRQGRLAQEELERLILEKMFSTDLTADHHQKIAAFIRDNVSSDFSPTIVRKAIVWSLKTALDDDLEFNADLLAKIRIGHSSEGGEQLIRQLGALAAFHADGARLKEALLTNNIPVKDKLEDLVRFSKIGSEGYPSNQEVVDYLASHAGPDRLDKAIGVIGNVCVELRNKIARIWRRQGRLNDVLRLLKGIADMDAPGTGFAQANYLMAQSENDLGLKKKAAQRYASIIERWPHYPEICVRSARAASELFLEIGDKKAAKQVLESGSKHATGTDRIDLTRMAMEID